MEYLIPEDLKEEYCRLQSVRQAIGTSSAVMTTCEAIGLIERVARLDAQNAQLIEALDMSLRAIDAFWPVDAPESEMESQEDRAIARIRKQARAALDEWKDAN